MQQTSYRILLIPHVSLRQPWATPPAQICCTHYDDVIMSTIASQITSLTIVYSTVYLDADQRTRQSSASLAFVCGIHRGPVNSPHKWPVTRKMFPFDDVIMFRVHFIYAVDIRHMNKYLCSHTACAMITYPCHGCNGGWVEPLLKSGRGWGIASHMK